MTLLREFGPWRSLDLLPEDVRAVKSVSHDLKDTLGLNELPLLTRSVNGRTQIRARHVSGFVHIGELTVEIAPKFLHSESRPEWRDAFLAILARVGPLDSLPPLLGGHADEGIPDLMGLIVNDALTQAGSQGLPRQYVEERGDMEAVRGQIDAERLWHRLVAPGSIPCRYDNFVEDTPVARLLKWAARNLADVVSAPWLATQLWQHAEALPSVADERPTPFSLGRAVVAPSHAFLSDAVEVAKILATGSALTLSDQDDAPARAFLWKTSTVFEDFVFAVCEEAVARDGGEASKSALTLGVPLVKTSSQWPITTTPDVSVRYGSWTTLLDAKYKTLGKAPKSQDTYQVMAGARLLASQDVSLVYPAQRTFATSRTWRLRGKGSPASLHALPLDLLMMAEPNGFDILVDRMQNHLRTLRRSATRTATAPASAHAVGQR